MPVGISVLIVTPVTPGKGVSQPGGGSGQFPHMYPLHLTWSSAQSLFRAWPGDLRAGMIVAHMWFLAVFYKPDALPGAEPSFFFPGLGLAHTSAGLRRMRQSYGSLLVSLLVTKGKVCTPNQSPRVNLRNENRINIS